MAEQLRAARKALGLTQAEAARELGVATATLGRWEAGLKIPGRLAQLDMAAWLRRAPRKKEGRDGA